MDSKYNIINTFNNIEIKCVKTLIICDIDNTILCYEKNIEDFIKIIKKDFPEFTENEIIEDAVYMYNIYRCINKPLHTDFDGFINIKNRLNELDGNLIFLTARNSSSLSFTKKDFNNIGLNYDEYEIHYTDNKISKGQYIEKYINIKDYNEVIFIDDYESYIKSVSDIFPQIKCYLFDYKKSDL
jgi:hypothetical protein